MGSHSKGNALVPPPTFFPDAQWRPDCRVLVAKTHEYDLPHMRRWLAPRRPLFIGVTREGGEGRQACNPFRSDEPDGLIIPLVDNATPGNFDSVRAF
jgi:hypothetical protein